VRICPISELQKPSVRAGIDTRLKACYVFSLVYGQAARSSWLLLQKAVYGIDTEHDSDNAKVLQLLADCGKTECIPIVGN
jgi:hypothetical protein